MTLQPSRFGNRKEIRIYEQICSYVCAMKYKCVAYNPKFYKYICSKLKIKNKKKILFIGDTIYNDIIGANNFGIDSLLVKKSKLYKFKIKNFKIINVKKKSFYYPKYSMNEIKII